MKNHKKARKIPYLASRGFAFSEKPILFYLKVYSILSPCDNTLRTSSLCNQCFPLEIFLGGFFNSFYLFVMQNHTLRANSLGMLESIIMGIAGTAPAFSIEATAFTIIGIA